MTGQVGGELLGGTSFARGGPASASMIELIGEAGVVAQSASLTVIAYRKINSSNYATPSNATMFAKLTPSGSGTVYASGTVTPLAKRRVVPVTPTTTASISAFPLRMYAKPTITSQASVSTTASVIRKRKISATAKSVLATVTGANVIHVPVEINRDCSASGSASCLIKIPLTPVLAPCQATTSGSAILRLSVATAPVPESVASAAFIVEISNSPTPEERVMVVPEEIRRMESTAMTFLGKYEKQPAETLDYEIDFSTFLPSDDAIDAVDDPPRVLIEPSGLTQVGFALVTDQVVKLWFSGGTDGVTYKITVTVTSEQGRIKQNEFKIKVKDI